MENEFKCPADRCPGIGYFAEKCENKNMRKCPADRCPGIGYFAEKCENKNMRKFGVAHEIF